MKPDSPKSHVNSPPRLTVAERPIQLNLIAGIIALVAIVGSGVVGYTAYVRSASIIHRTALVNTLNRAKTLSAEADAHADDFSVQEILSLLQTRWTNSTHQYQNSFLCVVGPDGRLLLNTRRPDKVGVSVGKVRIPDTRQQGISALEDLLEKKIDWYGENVNHAGAQQIVAYAFAPDLDCLIAVHIPSASIAAEVKAASLPWALGWGFVALVLMPSSIALSLRAFRSSQEAKNAALEQLESTEMKLRQSRDFFLNAFQDFPLLIWRTAPTGNYSFFNQTWLSFTGRTLQEEIGSGWTANLKKEDRERCLKENEEAFSSREAFYTEFQLRHHSGEYRWVANWGRPLIARDGTFDGYIGACEDITERKRSAESAAELSLEREETNERLHVLSRKLLEIQESERHHLARELHDEIGQIVTATRINIQALSESRDLEELKPRLDDSIEVLDRLLDQIRQMSLNLRPPLLDDFGLKAALRSYVKQQAERSGIDLQFLTNLGDLRLASSVETACFRVAQEAVTNILRHSGATMAEVEVHHTETGVCLCVSDNGNGFDVAKANKESAGGTSFGLTSMEERMGLVNGRLTISSSPESGTTVSAVVPLVSLDVADLEIVCDTC